MKTAIALLGVLVVCAIVLAWGLLPRLRPRFDGRNAFAHLAAQCAFGPRVPGSDAHRQCLEYLEAELRRHCHRVSRHTFSYTTRRQPPRSVQGTNLVASILPVTGSRPPILLCAHWDSRPWADRDPDPARRTQPVPGANDGASGVAVLLEAARVLRANPSDVGVDIVLFDLEDMGDEGAERDPHNRDPFCIGSERFLADNPSYRPAFGILVDMVGDRALRIPKEGFSVQHAPHVVEMVWRAARRVGASAFVEERGGAILDDHVPFLKRGIPVVDLIDFDYPHWHTTGDTPDRCAPESLQQVGDVLLRVIRDHGQR